MGAALDDEVAFANSIEPLIPIAFRLAYGMLRNRDEAEDAVQEAAMKAWRKRATFGPLDRPRELCGRHSRDGTIARVDTVAVALVG